MKTKVLAVGIILVFLGVAVTPSINLNVVKASNDSDYVKVITQTRESEMIKREPNTFNPLDRPEEVIDQQQTTAMNWGVLVFSRHWEAQSFTPTLNLLTKIKVLFFKSGFPQSGINLTVHIRANLSGEDLAILSTDASIIPHDGYWVEFNFPDITLIPGNKYYIICNTNSENDMIGYCWNFNRYNVYDRGEAWRSNDSGVTWSIREDPPDWVGLDYCFITYGFWKPPDIPTIDGPSLGSPGVEYTFSASVTDPEPYNISCKWDWGDGNISDWVGPYSSGQTISASYAWTQAGVYEIKAKFKDQYEAESNWSEPYSINIINTSMLSTIWLIGLISNLDKRDNLTSFNAENLLCVHFSPFYNVRYRSDEKLVVSNDYLGKVRQHFIIGRFKYMVI